METIAKLDTNNLSDISLLIREYWRFEQQDGFDERIVSQALSDLVSRPGLGAGWIVYVEDEAVAYLLSVYVFSLEHYGLTAEIDEFYVRESFRHRGLGKRLLKAAEAEASALGCRNISLQIAKTNTSAHAFYKACGFAERQKYKLLEKDLSGQAGT